MTRIVITGSAGKAGAFVVREFAAHGYDTLGVDVKATVVSSALGHLPSMKADLRDLGQAVESFEGADAIVHLANVSLPGMFPPGKTFSDNLTVNYNVFQAARLLGIHSIVWLSSAAVINDLFDPLGEIDVPVTEDSPVRAGSTYALSKIMTEQMAEFFCDERTSIVGLRAPVIEDPADYPHYAKYHGDPQVRRWHLWSYIDARDLARACRLAVEARPIGVHNVFVSARDTVMAEPIDALFKLRFPGAPVPGRLRECGSFFAPEHAKRLFGFEPIHSWRDDR
ncbi:NAD-dependent epimerase/dehydratase family protein [Burkholderia oklahomensis]|uniref:3-beta hydroxysteroid dehydrogenase/isomerase family protein n=1 Tax=Burkholderia oklahomensis TaxID=342113 RepID=A0AAI8BF15_9BURK|nr:NAD(P)-dependent oxidoreductase [Burkholderia oklahomensis]AIO70915.1 3-beta hydroxysteroid dehydrogenase/isomerase family protein [Burkholderia oklahomensis]AJX35139.1 3-beta hydroxysteroid dehydrogenase/isomerase family protein [Burkholderia oklahomensis C6786]AOI40478.1 epimerase [Burkholderia oklahomensis EO147]AOI50112.1 epimerase [Burkholderia oklahomensis C6786]KUY48688.1 epimerase [Burkholderia oklahomensis EO147]